MPKTLAERVEQAIKSAGVNISTVTIGDAANKATWRVTPSSLQQQAQPVIDGYGDPTPTTLLSEEAQAMISEKRIRAVTEALWEAIPAYAGKPTKAQTLQRAIDIYKTP